MELNVRLPGWKHSVIRWQDQKYKLDTLRSVSKLLFTLCTLFLINVAFLALQAQETKNNFISIVDILNGAERYYCWSLMGLNSVGPHIHRYFLISITYLSSDFASMGKTTVNQQ